MQYLVLFVFVCAFIVAIISATVKIIGLKQLFLQKIIAEKLVNNLFFSTLPIKDLACYILKQKKHLKKQMLQCISDDNFINLAKFLNNPLIKAKLDLILNGKISNLKNSDHIYELMKVCCLLQKNKHQKASEILFNLNVNKMSSVNKAVWRLCSAKIALFEGDFLSASEDAAFALKILHKTNLFFEEAETYFVLGTLYRVSGIYDSADFMLRSALDLFHSVGCLHREIEVLGALGLLMSVQERFVEADDYFKKARDLAYKSDYMELCFFADCQSAMLKLVQNDTSGAEKIIRNILKEHLTASVKAMSFDILARIKMVQKKYCATTTYSQKASFIYYEKRNFAAAFDCLYLAAEALFNVNKIDEAENILRDLIKKEKYHKSCFHIANAFTLLGVILLQKSEFSRAKAIFNLALKQELYNDRKTGIAIDYANLAMVERKCGNMSDARKNLETALKYAENTDKDLYTKIKDALD